VKCDHIDPMKTGAANKWANSGLAKPHGETGSSA
jgi:hypothetical protein